MDTKTALDKFTWDLDDGWSPEDFFKEGESPSEKLDDKPSDIDKIEEDEKKDIPFIEEEEEDEFEKEVKEEPKEEVAEPEQKEEEDINVFTAAAKDLQELGFFGEVEDKLDAVSFMERIESTLEDRIDSGIQQIIEEWKEQIGNTGAEFVKFTMNGGNPDDFFKTYSKSTLSFDIESDTGQESFLKYYYKEIQGMDDDDIEDLVESHKEGDKLGKYAKQYYKKLAARREAEAQELLESQEAYRERQAAAKREFVNRIRSTVKDTDHMLIRGKNGKELGKIQFTEVEKRSLLNYITQNNIQMGDKYVSQMTSDINKIFREEPDKLVLLAKLLKNDFDLSDLVKNKVTEEVKEIKSNLQRIEKKKKTKPTTVNTRPLWEVLD